MGPSLTLIKLHKRSLITRINTKILLGSSTKIVDRRLLWGLSFGNREQHHVTRRHPYPVEPRLPHLKLFCATCCTLGKEKLTLDRTLCKAEKQEHRGCTQKELPREIVSALV